MNQQIPPPSKLRKGFLGVGIALLILGFVFFYEAGQLHSAQVTTYNDAVNLADNTQAFADNYSFPQWGPSYYYPVRVVFMQPNDFITVNYFKYTPFTGTTHIVIDFYGNLSDTATYTDFNSLSFVNNGVQKPQSNNPSTLIGRDGAGTFFVEVFLVTQNIQNLKVGVFTELNHYETPQWVYFGVGVVLCSLAMIPIFKSKK